MSERVGPCVAVQLYWSHVPAWLRVETDLREGFDVVTDLVLSLAPAPVVALHGCGQALKGFHRWYVRDAQGRWYASERRSTAGRERQSLRCRT